MPQKPPTKSGLNSIFTRRIRKLFTIYNMFEKKTHWLLKVSFSTKFRYHRLWQMASLRMLMFVRPANRDKCGINTKDNNQVRTGPHYSILSQNIGNFRAEKEGLLNYTDVQLSSTRWIA